MDSSARRQVEILRKAESRRERNGQRQLMIVVSMFAPLRARVNFSRLTTASQAARVHHCHTLFIKVGDRNEKRSALRQDGKESQSLADDTMAAIY